MTSPDGDETNLPGVHAPADTSLTSGAPGSLDGEGAGDHDLEFRFGRLPRAVAPYPFSTRQYARLLVLRSRLDGLQLDPSDRQAA